MTLNKRAKVWIYGYGQRGRNFEKRMYKEGIEICGFLDRAPERYQPGRIQIRRPDDVKPSSDMVVICSISNVFLHEEIASQLAKLGFEYIVYKSFRMNPAGKAVSALYNRLTSVLGDIPFTGLDVPAYADIAKPVEESSAARDGIVYTDIAAELLFGLTRELLADSFLWKDKELLERIPEKSLLFYTPPQKMMKYFAGEIDEEAWQESRRLWEMCRDAQSFSNPLKERYSEKEQTDNLEDRYRIFEKMNQIFCENPSFFRENPISVVWNERGWFHIQDGNNRAAFLLMKGMYWIPAQMTVSDYAAWLRGEGAAAEVKTVLSQSEAGLRSPILYPQLKNIETALGYYSHRKVAALCDWLWKRHLEPKNSTVCEFYCSNDLCGSHMARMGSHLTVVDTEEQVTLHKALDKLYRLDTVHYGVEKPHSFHIILSNRETALGELMESGLQADWYILEFVDKNDEEIEAIAGGYSLEKTEYLIRQLVGAKIYKTAVLKRRTS